MRCGAVRCDAMRAPQFVTNQQLKVVHAVPFGERFDTCQVGPLRLACGHDQLAHAPVLDAVLSVHGDEGAVAGR